MPPFEALLQARHVSIGALFGSPRFTASSHHSKVFLSQRVRLKRNPQPGKRSPTRRFSGRLARAEQCSSGLEMGYKKGLQTVLSRHTSGCGSKLNRRGYAGFGACFHFPGFHFGTGLLSHSHIMILWYIITPFCTLAERSVHALLSSIKL